MKRFIESQLEYWKTVPYRKPLLLRGARQVGKTYIVQQFGKQFSSFVQINCEEQPDVRSIFEKDLDAQRIMRDLAFFTKTKIIPGQTLLFIDEIQKIPEAITALRYFYERIPELHVIAAGSLLDFAIEEVGIPVGRVESLYLYPLSFLEFLLAMGNDILVDEILAHPANEPLAEPVHNQLLALVGEYMAIGGMPGIVDCWITTKNATRCFELQHAILDTYRNDFVKYAKKHQVKYVDLIFKTIPQQLGRKFKFSLVEGEYRKRELAPALDLLVTAGIAHTVMQTPGQGLPLGAHADPQNYKVLFLDVALSQALLGLEVQEWFLNPLQQLANKGEITETFVGQELLAYGNAHAKNQLYYWQRNVPNSAAEIDYLIQKKEHIIPIEVKSGTGTALKSLNLFLQSHPQTPYGIRLSTHNYSEQEKLKSLPLYAIAALSGHFKQKE